MLFKIIEDILTCLNQNQKTSAVKRLKYLIAINRINVIVNLRLIAINHTYLSILNVPSFLFVPLFFSHFNALINMEKWIGLLCANVLFIENNIGIYSSVQFHTNNLTWSSHSG